MMKKPVIRLMAFCLVLIVIAAFAWQWWQSQQTLLPADIATGNKRIEANQIDITTKYAYRVKRILVQVDDLVTPDQVLAKMDTT